MSDSYFIDEGVRWHFTLFPFRDYGKWRWLFYKTHDIRYINARLNALSMKLGRIT